MGKDEVGQELWSLSVIHLVISLGFCFLHSHKHMFVTMTREMHKLSFKISDAVVMKNGFWGLLINKLTDIRFPSSVGIRLYRVET